MDEPARRVLHRFKHGESVQEYRSEFGFIYITLLRTKNVQIRVKFVDTEKILDFRIGPKFGLIRCSKGDKILHFLANIRTCELWVWTVVPCYTHKFARIIHLMGALCAKRVIILQLHKSPVLPLKFTLNFPPKNHT